MLQAINSNKAGRNISSEEIHWREIFKASEDSLTSTIISLLFYLPLELAWQILKEACYDQNLPTPLRILSIQYWPSWNANGTDNIYRVEPDVFIRTDSFDIIIEAKRFDHHQQTLKQLETEFKAYLNEYGDENRNVWMIALGGLNSEQTETLVHDIYSVKIIKCRWARIAKSVQQTFRQMEQIRNLLNINGSILNILDDLLLGFRIHGFTTTEWFIDTNFKKFHVASKSIMPLAMLNIIPKKTDNWSFRSLQKFKINPLSLITLKEY